MMMAKVDCKKCAWNTTRNRKSAVMCRIPAYWMKKITSDPKANGLGIGNWTNKKVTVNAFGCIYYLKMPSIRCPRFVGCSHKAQKMCTQSLPDFIECIEGLTPYLFDVCFGEGAHKNEIEILQSSRQSGVRDDTLTRLLKRFIEPGCIPPCVVEE